MKLTTKGRYAVSAIMDIAMQGNNSLVPLSEISARQGISISYLEQLFSKLKKAGLVGSVRGTNGGYKISQPISEITVFEIMQAVNEDINATQCNGFANCHEGNQCNTHDLWYGLTRHIVDYLKEITLEDLIKKHTNSDANIHEIKFVPANQLQKQLQTANVLK